MTPTPSRAVKVACTMLAVAVLLAGVAGCASSRAARKGDQAFRRGNWDAAVAYYQEALDRDPDNKQYEIRLKRAQSEASQMHQAAGKQLWQAGRLTDAALEYELALRLDSTNELAATEYQHVQEELELETAALEPSRLERIKREAREVAPPIPRLEPGIDEPLSVSFRQANVTEIYEALAAVAGLNVVFDSGIQDRPASLVVQHVDFFEALDAFAGSQGHFYKAISSKTFIVVVDNPNKRQQFAEEVMRTYYLSNTTAEELGRMLQELLQAQRLSINTDLNTVTLRDAPAVIQHADRIVAMIDKSMGEVLLDVEILEANRRVLREYGMSLEPSQVVQSLRQGGGTTGEPDGISLQRLRFLNANDWFFTVPSIRYRLFKESGDFKMVADPQLRLTEGQQAALLVGNEVPIVITTFNPTQLSGNQVVPIRSTDYRDVGISVEAVTRVHHNREVTLELRMEVSSIAGTGIEQLPIFGTRQITTVTRLRDGETHVLAGLLRDDERTSMEGFPGLSDIPVLGRLFSSTTREVEQTDVIMTITPHILRNADINLADLEAVYMGRQNRADVDAMATSGAVIEVGSGRTVGATPMPTADLAGVSPLPDEVEGEPRPLILGLVPGADRTSIEESLVVGVDIDRARPAGQMRFVVVFDAERVGFVDLTAGPWLQDVGGSIGEVTLTEPGRLEWTVTLDDSGVEIDPSGRLAILELRPLRTGIGTLQLDVEVVGPDGVLREARALGAAIEVVE